ncbi:MAG: penicillin-binding protein [Candidatus Kerfeldbacteria bacterium]|nr:penicillin-binding protein [Candidatus Kerfeldbacteria bacterium]
MPIPYLKKKSDKKTIATADNVRKKRASERSKNGDEKTTVKKMAAGRLARIRAWLTWKRVLWIVGSTCAFFLVAGTATGIGLYLWVSKDLADVTDLDKVAVEKSTKILARDGTTLLYEVGDNKREDVTLDKVDVQIQQATIVLEDRDFYKHHGINFLSLARAAISNFFNLKTGQGGASTLTQQFIKNAIIGNEGSYIRKIKEAILAFRLEQKYSKDEILSMYLNEVYYGRNYQGIEVSTEKFFHKTAQEVTIAEAATLAALPNNPPYYLNNPDKLLSRRNRAIDAMVEAGYVTQEEGDAAKAEELTLQDDEITDINAPHFVRYIEQELFDQYGSSRVRKEGLVVVTTLDWDKQQKAERAITDGIVKVEKYNGDNAALVSIDTKTGQILAMVGSRNYFDKEHDGEYNVATSYNRQPGSSFKPIVYYTAFSKGYIPETKVVDAVTDFPQDGAPVYRPFNFNGEKDQRGPVTLRYALNQSLNIPAVKMMYLVGKDAVLDVTDSLGYTSLKDREFFGSGLSLSLGAGNVSLLEHTSTYATFAREGERHAPAGILSIKDQMGNTLYEWQDTPQQVLDKDAARTLNNVLSDSGARGATFAELNLSGRQVAAKTGTSNDFKDAWAMGYTPSIATGVWTGRNDNQPMDYLGDGVVIAAPIFKAYMNSILDGTPAETFNAPNYTAANEVLGGNLEKIVNKKVDSVTGHIIPDECTTYPSQYIAQKDFKELHSILFYIERTHPKGGTPEDPAKDPMYASWEKAVQEWVKKNKPNDYLTEDTPKIACDYRDPATQPTTSITSLEDGETYIKSEFRIRGTVRPGTGRTITAIAYIIDDITVETISGQTITSNTEVSSSYRPKTLTVGRHSVTIKVTDDRGNTATDVITVRYAGDTTTEETTNTNSNTNSNTNTSTNSNDNTNTSVDTNVNLNLNTNQ